MRDLKVGDTVKLKIDLLGNPQGDEGVVIEVYKIGDKSGVQVIFENGEYDGFDVDEQEEYLERTGHCEVLADYKFFNVMQLGVDFDAGRFDPVFNS